MRAKTIKSLRSQCKANLHDLKFQKFGTKSINQKENIDELNLIRIKSLCSSKDSIKKVKMSHKIEKKI